MRYALLDNVSFFKVGLQLFMTGGMPTLLQSLRGKRVFVDLKVPGDIGNTITGVIDVCYDHGVAFLTLSDSMPAPAIRVAAAARNAHSGFDLKLLTVPLVSSLDASDLAEITGTTDDLETYVLTRAKRAIDAGCDGVIASGDAIQWCRRAFPRSDADRESRHSARGCGGQTTRSDIPRRPTPFAAGPTTSWSAGRSSEPRIRGRPPTG